MRRPARLVNPVIGASLFRFSNPARWKLIRGAQPGPSPARRDRSEFYLMGFEKIAAFYESWTAMSIEMLRVNLEYCLLPAQYFWQGLPVTRRSSRAAAAHFQRAALAVLGAGVAPIHRRAVANA